MTRDLSNLADPSLRHSGDQNTRATKSRLAQGLRSGKTKLHRLKSCALASLIAKSAQPFSPKKTQISRETLTKV